MFLFVFFVCLFVFIYVFIFILSVGTERVANTTNSKIMSLLNHNRKQRLYKYTQQVFRMLMYVYYIVFVSLFNTLKCS